MSDTNWFNPVYGVAGLEAALVGRRVMDVQMDVDDPPPGDNWEIPRPVGRATLDDGTAVYFAGHDGCACYAGCYDLTTLNRVDNIITAVRVDEKPGGEDSPDGTEGSYSIFVLAEHEQLLASFDGTDGNGYYGTGFNIRVVSTTSA